MRNTVEPSPSNSLGGLVRHEMAKLSPVTRCWKNTGPGVLLACLFFPFVAGQAQQPPAPNLAGNRHWRQIEWFYRQRAYPLGHIPAEARRKSLDQLDQMLEREGKKPGPPSASPLFVRSAPLGGAPLVVPSTAQWTLIGPEPTNVTDLNVFSGGPTTSGRVTALAVDPGNSSIVYLGGAQGGVWKTTDGGAHWTPLTDTQPSLAVGSIALDPSNSSIVYVGTGEENYSLDSYYGAGVLKSTNGGSTWTQLGASVFVGPFGPGSASGGTYIGAVAVHPTNGQIVLAAVNTSSGTNPPGIYRSTDGGSAWTNVLSGAPGDAVLFDPTNGSIAYASLDTDSVYKSINGGATWGRADASGTNKLPTTNVGRIALAITPTSTSTLYAGIANNTDGSLLGLYKSTDSGKNWSQLSSAPDYCSPQCWYDNVITVDPANASYVFAGGINQGVDEILIRSLDGGSTWASIDVGANGVALHTDMHALAFASDGSVLYNGNDGGAWSSTNFTTATATDVNWTDLNGPLAITQFYPGLSIHPTNSNIALGGTQDNGTENYVGSLGWDEITCGDGGWTAIDPITPSNVYASCSAISIEKSTTGALGTWNSAQTGINTLDRSIFIPPMVMDPSHPATLYFGTYLVYQTTDGANTWTAISGDLTGGSGNVTTIAVAPSSSNTVYVGADTPKVQVTTNAGLGTSSTWTDITAGLPPRYVTQIAVDLLTSSTAYVTFSGFSGFGGDTQGHVFKTINGGTHWTDISGNLPNTPVNDIAVDPDIANTLYVATDVGVFRTSNGGTTWSTLVTGLPRVAVLSLTMHRASRTLRAGTHGRSVWDLNIPFKKTRAQLVSE